MKLYHETRIQALMLVTSFIGIVTTAVLLVVGLVKGEMIYLVCAGIDLVIVFLLITIGQRWTQQTMARLKKIREGGGDETDLEWITRPGSGFKKTKRNK
jgi:uncharacterized membrane protein